MSEAPTGTEEDGLVASVDGVEAAAKAPKSSVYAVAADPTKYRVKDATLFSCAAHTDAAVLCTTAGKTGRNGRTAAVGATIIWLTCPYLNNMVARIERHNGVQIAARCLQEHEALRRRHVSSHEDYLAVAKTLLTEAQWSFFCDHFVTPADGAGRKFGNAAVSHEDDLKCLHALVAQSLGGAANPLGDAVINYILFCHSLMSGAAGEAERSCDQKSAIAALLDSDRLFSRFLAQTTALGKDQDGAVVPINVRFSDTATDLAVPGDELRHEWIASQSRLAALHPDLCERCLTLAAFVDGKRPTARRRKHRVN